MKSTLNLTIATLSLLATACGAELAPVMPESGAVAPLAVKQSPDAATPSSERLAAASAPEGSYSKPLRVASAKDLPVCDQEGQFAFAKDEKRLFICFEAAWEPINQKGDKGLAGEKGIDGSSGSDGVAGSSGAQGLKGDKGDQGDKGDRGDQGLAGASGMAGTVGATGATGAKGNTGDGCYMEPFADAVASGITVWCGGGMWQIFNGVDGVAGAAGTAGANGATGAAGATGSAATATRITRKDYCVSTKVPTTWTQHAGQNSHVYVYTKVTYSSGDTRGTLTLVVPDYGDYDRASVTTDFATGFGSDAAKTRLSNDYLSVNGNNGGYLDATYLPATNQTKLDYTDGTYVYSMTTSTCTTTNY